MAGPRKSGGVVTPPAPSTAHTHIEADVTGLTTDLAAKAPASRLVAGLALTADITVSALKTALALVKGDVGLGNVDNTSDANKPVSTAQATALANKLQYKGAWDGTATAYSTNDVVSSAGSLYRAKRNIAAPSSTLTYRGYGVKAAGTGNGSTIQVPLPAGSVAGDLCIALWGGPQSAGVALSVPSPAGWTIFGSRQDSNINSWIFSYLMYRTLTATDITNGYVDVSNQSYPTGYGDAGVIWVYASNASIDAATISQTGGSAGTLTWPSVTSTQANDDILQGVVGGINSTPTGWDTSGAFERNTTSGALAGAESPVTRVSASAGVPARTFTTSGAAQGLHNWSIAVKGTSIPNTLNASDWDLLANGASLTVQDENANVSTAVTQIDFQGAGVTATAGTGEVVVTIPGGTTTTSGLLSARPTATGSKNLYYATDVQQVYVDTAAGTWSPLAQASYDPRLFAYNTWATPKHRAANARARNAEQTEHVLGVFDSIGAGSTGISGNQATNSWPGRARTLLEQKTGVIVGTGIVEIASAATGGGGQPVATSAGSTYPYVTSSGLSQFSQGGLSGFAYTNSAGGTLTFGFQTVGSNATIKVWCYNYNGNFASTSVSLDSVGQTAITKGATASNAFFTASYTVASAGNHTIVLTSTAGMYIIGFEVIENTTSGVKVTNLGQAGRKTSDITGRISGALTAYAPDVTLIGLGTNDMLQGVSTSTFQTNMQTLITAALTTGDCILVVPPTDGSGNNNSALMQSYSAVYYALADSNNIPIVDMNKRLINYSTGLLNDGVGHLTNRGAWEFAAAVGAVLGQAVWL